MRDARRYDAHSYLHESAGSTPFPLADHSERLTVCNACVVTDIAAVRVETDALPARANVLLLRHVEETEIMKRRRADR